MYRRIADAFAMSDAAWRRHESPWSVWSRVAILPVLTAAILWRDALGPAFWPALAALLVFTWANPRLFPAPKDRMGWSPRAVRGERAWLDRRGDPALLRLVDRWAPAPAIGAPLWLWGLWSGHAGAAFAGAAVVALVKLKFLDHAAKLAAPESASC